MICNEIFQIFMHFCLIFIYFLEKELKIKNKYNFLHNKKIVTHGNKEMLHKVTNIGYTK